MEDTVLSGSALASELLDAAFAQNRYYNALSSQSEYDLEAKAEFDLAEQARKDASSEAIRMLMEAEGLFGDGLVEAYSDVLEYFGETYQLSQLEEMRRIGDRLVPGEVFIGYDGTIMKVADEQTEPAAPVLVPQIIESRDKLVGVRYRLAWIVPVVGIRQGVIVDNTDIAIGRSEVIQQLNLYNFQGVNSTEGFIGTATDYDSVGAAQESETYRFRAANRAIDDLRNDRFKQPEEIAEIISTLGNGGALEYFVNELAERIACADPDVTDLQYLAITRTLLAYEKPSHEAVSNSPFKRGRVFARYLELKELGRQRLDQTIDQN